MSFSFDDPSNFEVTTSFEEGRTVLSLHGRVENLAAFDLGASLDAAIDLHPETVILDLSELAFMGAAGVVAVANGEMRLAEAGIRLTVRTPSTLVMGLLGVMEPVGISCLEQVAPEHGHLGQEQMGASPVPSQPSTSNVSTVDLKKVTAIPSDPDVVDGALRLVVELAGTRVTGADGVSVSLLRHGVLSTVAASDQTIMDMDADQYATREGPCVDASLRGHWFHAESLKDETRWPSFTPRARALGIKAIFSSPLKAFELPVGALNMYSRTAGAFNVKAQETAELFARKASVILSDARADVSDTQVAAQFQRSLRSREIVALAKGIVMERDRVSEDDAFTALRRVSVDEGTSLLKQAEGMVLSARKPELGPEWRLDA
jgi:anti-anti-sigma regulatory factor